MLKVEHGACHTYLGKNRQGRFRPDTVLSAGDENCTAGVFFAFVVWD
jgi:hypothetical protein